MAKETIGYEYIDEGDTVTCVATALNKRFDTVLILDAPDGGQLEYWMENSEVGYRINEDLVRN